MSELLRLLIITLISQETSDQTLLCKEAVIFSSKQHFPLFHGDKIYKSI